MIAGPLVPWVLSFLTVILAFLPAASAREIAPEVERIRNELDHGWYADAEASARDWLAESPRGGSPLAEADALDLLVESLWRQHRYYDPEARELAERAVTLREDFGDLDDPGLVASLTNLANLLLSNAEFDPAASLFERALSMAESIYGPDHPSVARALDGLGTVHRQRGEREEADRLLERALRIKREFFGPEHPEVVVTLNLIGWGHYYGGDTSSAESNFAEASAIAQRVLGEGHPLVGESLRNLAMVLVIRGDLDGARSALGRAQEIARRTYGEKHHLTATTFSTLAYLHAREGDFGEAEALSRRALEIQEQLLGPQHYWLLPMLDMLAWTTHVRGDLAEAIRMRKRYVEILEVSLGSDHGLTAGGLAILGRLVWHVGDTAEAETLFRRALAAMESRSPPDEFNLFVVLAEFANFLVGTGRPREAIALCERAVPMGDRVFGTESPRSLISRRVHADALLAVGRIEEGRRIHEEVLETWTRLFGRDHLDVATLLESLARARRLSGDLVGAARDLEQALVIDEKSVGPEAFITGTCLGRLSSLLGVTGECERAFDGALRAERISRESLRLVSRGLSERETLRYVTSRPRGLALALSIAVNRSDLPVADTEIVWDAVMRSRAVVLDEMAARRLEIGDSADPEVARLADELSGVTARLANLTVRGPGQLGVEQYLAILEETKRRKESVEAALAVRVESFRKLRQAERIGYEEVIGALPRGSALVAFVRYDRAELRCPRDPAIIGSDSGGTPENRASTDGQSPPRPIRQSVPSYLALVMAPGDNPPRIVQLGRAVEIDRLVSAWHRAVSLPPEPVKIGPRAADRPYRAVAERLRRASWDPVAIHLGKPERVFVVPDGELHLVNFATLPVDSGRYLLETGPVIHYLSAERDLALQRVPTLSEELLAVGGPDFDASPGAPSEEAVSVALVRSAASGDVGEPRPLYRGPRSECESFGTLHFESLPGTWREVEEIANLWEADTAHRARAGKGVLKLTGVAAHEALFKRLAPGKRVLHLATHGFYLGGACASEPVGVGAGGAEVPSDDGPNGTEVPENPLLLSGLALAGANNRSEAEADQEDGILTAEEIASLDLSSADWVVLSACQTGTGRVMNGEGVLGLRRAFQIAGTRTLIMSLWSVQDEVARRFMRELYAARLEGQSTAHAVRRASLRMLEERRAAKQSVHPFYWGAFVAAGDW